MLAFSRGQPLDPEPVNANELVASMTELFARTLGEKVSLKTAVVENLWTVEADPNQFEASLLNLVVNARDAMPKGGSLTIETANVKLNAAYAAKHEGVVPGDYVAITVSDTGIGMSPETLARVFEPFFTTKPAGEGTGLGLSQLYGFVKQSGGHVNVESILGSGTKVSIYLPRYTGEAANLKSGRKAQEDDRNTVLIVEDDDDVRQYSVSLFRELGYGVLEAPTAWRRCVFWNRGPRYASCSPTSASPETITARSLPTRRGAGGHIFECSTRPVMRAPTFCDRGGWMPRAGRDQAVHFRRTLSKGAHRV